MGSIPVGVTSGKVPPPIITRIAIAVQFVRLVLEALAFFLPEGQLPMQVAIYAVDMQFQGIDHIPAPFLRKRW